MQVNDRQIETIKTVTVVQHHRVEVPVQIRPATVAGFVKILDDLTRRIDSGRVSDRDLPALVTAVRAAVEALARREKAAARNLW